MSTNSPGLSTQGALPAVIFHRYSSRTQPPREYAPTMSTIPRSGRHSAAGPRASNQGVRVGLFRENGEAVRGRPQAVDAPCRRNAKLEYRGMALVDRIWSTRIVPFPGQDSSTSPIKHS
jgi:hypothetical protein